MKIRIYDTLNNYCWVGLLIEDKGEVFVVKNIGNSFITWEFKKKDIGMNHWRTNE